MQKENIVENLTDCITNHTPIIYSKYGDGEYLCANFGKIPLPDTGSHNCDGDNYSEKKGQGIVDSFKYIVNNVDNAYIGAWETPNVTDYWQSLVEPEKIKWANYHTFIIGDEDIGTDELDKKVALYKSIKESKLKKIMICNMMLIKSKPLLDIDTMVHVPYQNWYDDNYDILLERIKEVIGENEQFIVMTACGMSAKILIADLVKDYPKGIFLDIGSALDYLCTQSDTRGRKYSYNDLCNIFQSILPEDWNDFKYHQVYFQSKLILRQM